MARKKEFIDKSVIVPALLEDIMGDRFGRYAKYNEPITIDVRASIEEGSLSYEWQDIDGNIVTTKPIYTIEHVRESTECSVKITDSFGCNA